MVWSPEVDNELAGTDLETLVSAIRKLSHFPRVKWFKFVTNFLNVCGRDDHKN